MHVVIIVDHSKTGLSHGRIQTPGSMSNAAYISFIFIAHPSKNYTFVQRRKAPGYIALTAPFVCKLVQIITHARRLLRMMINSFIYLAYQGSCLTLLIEFFIKCYIVIKSGYVSDIVEHRDTAVERRLVQHTCTIRLFGRIIRLIHCVICDECTAVLDMFYYFLLFMTFDSQSTGRSKRRSIFALTGRRTVCCDR